MICRLPGIARLVGDECSFEHFERFCMLPSIERCQPNCYIQRASTPIFMIGKQEYAREFCLFKCFFCLANVGGAPEVADTSPGPPHFITCRLKHGASIIKIGDGFAVVALT